ncbi:hypothetical protein DL764_004195 [Monosporascus ibericus]|uniref:Uncharacterized protein n=1 Tax=Monosporascus ibericus TaxID=155417 RepID=A0A4Q4TFI3_9PEZI|nr:hypothetical protein DL764_004195 [Monosporascus ibericus]
MRARVQRVAAVLGLSFSAALSNERSQQYPIPPLLPDPLLLLILRRRRPDILISMRLRPYNLGVIDRASCSLLEGSSHPRMSARRAAQAGPRLQGPPDRVPITPSAARRNLRAGSQGRQQLILHRDGVLRHRPELRSRVGAVFKSDELSDPFLKAGKNPAGLQTVWVTAAASMIAITTAPVLAVPALVPAAAAAAIDHRVSDELTALRPGQQPEQFLGAAV